MKLKWIYGLGAGLASTWSKLFLAIILDRIVKPE